MKFRSPFVFLAITFALGVFAISAFLMNGARASASKLYAQNMTDVDTKVFVAFGADSKITAANWPFCKTAGSNCVFALPKHGSKDLPLGGHYLNATFSFGAPATCGTTKAEFNINNPKWYDTVDVSLVDGYSNKVSILVPGAADASAPISLGPPNGRDGNEKVYGLFPYGCDICVARNSPPCGISKGKEGCKSGTQYKPDVPCQYQGRHMGGGQDYWLRLHKD